MKVTSCDIDIINEIVFNVFEKDHPFFFSIKTFIFHIVISLQSIKIITRMN